MLVVAWAVEVSSAMKDVNRGVLIIKPKQPFVDWANSLDDDEPRAVIGNLRKDCTAYLIPDLMNEDEVLADLELNFELLFEHELEGWCIDQTTWPADRSFEMFQEWFDVEWHSVVFDLVT